MMTKTVPANAAERRTRTGEVRKMFETSMEDLGLENVYFVAKTPSIHDTLGKTIGFFESELSRGLDVYIALVNKYYELTDDRPVLYRLRYNPHYKEEFTKSYYGDKDDVFRYLVQVDELERVTSITHPNAKRDALMNSNTTSNVTANLDVTSITPSMASFEPKTDVNMSQATLRDIAAIMLKKPVSNKEWLNTIIKTS